jgi:precorrin-6Y C5,15-methyltransferase (decarboxylating)
VDRLQVVEGRAPEVLAGLAAPSAVFVGGGLSADLLAHLETLPPGTRIVANAVTLESEALLIDLRARHGGQLAKLQVTRAEPVGPRTGWRPFMPVTQWSLVKRGSEA